jgi:DNA-binding CsgD family transcriptional regulator
VSDGLKFFTEDGFGNIWYATREETGLLIPSPGFESAYKKHLINYLNGLLPEGFQKIIVIDRENVLIPAEKGFIHFNPSKYLADTATFYIKLASIQIKNQADSTVFSSISCQKPIPDKFSFNSNDRALTFRFTTCDNTAFDHVDYRYQLAGDNNQWSDWTDEPIINYNNLASGEYLLRVQARNGFGKISHTVTVVFYISPPWYKSLVAYGFYSIGLLGLMIYLLKKQDARHKADKERIHSEIETKEMVYRQQAELSQLEINRLQNEKLEAEIRSKNNELTSYTYHLVNKNDLIQKIREEVSQMEHKFHNELEIKKDLRNILRLVDNDEELDEDWENFVKSFDQVHADFYRRLNEKFTDLSPSDYKLCTYLKMNLTSKEIASLMNISIRSVETNRYRLRKKLNLDHDENLTQFILKF